VFLNQPVAGGFCGVPYTHESGDSIFTCTAVGGAEVGLTPDAGVVFTMCSAGVGITTAGGAEVGFTAGCWYCTGGCWYC
jgi:hypothetical protein